MRRPTGKRFRTQAAANTAPNAGCGERDGRIDVPSALERYPWPPTRVVETVAGRTDPMTRSRRALLARVGGAIAAVGTTTVTGCLDFAAGDGAQGPDGTPATLACPDEGFVRLDAPFDEPVETRTVDTDDTRFELSTEATSETYGSTLRLVLRNSGEETARTEGEYAYSIQRRTDEGWLDVRGATGGAPVALPREERSLDPNGTYSWSLRLNEESLASAVPDRELDVCPPLGPGTHRFVYWGIVDASPVGVEFELVG